MKKIAFSIALILFGFSMTYISFTAPWEIMQPASVFIIFIGLAFSVAGYIEDDK